MSRQSSAEQTQATPLGISLSGPQWASLMSAVPSSLMAQSKASCDRLTDLSKQSVIAGQGLCLELAQGFANYATAVGQFAHQNSIASFEFWGQLLNVRSPFEALDLTCSETKRQYEALAKQSERLWTLGADIISRTTKRCSEAAVGTDRGA